MRDLMEEITCKDTAILYTAAQCGNFNAVKLLTENDYDVNVQISNKCLLLLAAFENDKFEISRYLIKHGSNVNHSMNDWYKRHILCHG